MKLSQETLKQLSTICLAQSVLCNEQEIVDDLSNVGFHLKKLDNLITLAIPHIYKAMYHGRHEQDRAAAKELYYSLMGLNFDLNAITYGVKTVGDDNE